MLLKELFPDNALASTSLPSALIPGLTNAGPNGPIVSQVGLKAVSDNVYINLLDGAMTASHSRPSMFAHIFSFAENVKKAAKTISAAAATANYTAYDALEDYVKQDFIEWQGLIAAVALSNVYSGNGLNLSIKTVALDAKNLLDLCILREMDKGGVYQAAVTHDVFDRPVSAQLFYICQNDEPFALFHPEIGLCAMKEYKHTIFKGILPWYKPGMDSCHKSWNPVAVPNEPTATIDFCLSRIAWWADNLASVNIPLQGNQVAISRTTLLDYAGFLRTKMSNPHHTLNPDLKAPGSIPRADGIDNIAQWNGLGAAFGTTMMFYRDENGVARKLPMLFLDSLMLTTVGNQDQNKLVYNTSSGPKPICFEGNPDILSKFAPVAPFRRALVELLASCKLEDLNFKANLVDHKLDSIEVKVKLLTRDGEYFEVPRVYGVQDLIAGVIPYMMVWPYMAMPTKQDGTPLWKNYYATWQAREGGLPRLETRDDASIYRMDLLSFDYEDQGTARQILRVTSAQETAWTVCNGTQPFRYSLLKGKRSAEAPEELMGLVFIPEYPVFNGGNAIMNDPVKLAVDFGTTSTVVGLRHTNMFNDAPFTLPFLDYSKTVTCEDAAAKKVLDEEHWLGNSEGGENWKKDGKIFSVAQLFQRLDGTGPAINVAGAAQNQQYYVDGRLFLLTSGGALSNFASALEGDQDPLQRQHIMNDMKFGGGLDTRNIHAASIYLAGIYMHAVLYLLHEKKYPGVGDFIELRVSYPNAVTKDALRNSWGYARRILDNVMDSSLTDPIAHLLHSNCFYSEATAASAYYKKTAGFATQNTMVSVDIGGGTTDVSISRQIGDQDDDMALSNLSVRYAGREIMVTSLIQSFRYFPKDSQLHWQAFQNMWRQNDTILRDQFRSLCHINTNPQDNHTPLGQAALQDLVYNSSVRMNVELLLNGGMQFDDDMSYRMVRQLIVLKFFMLMRLVAKKVGENIRLWNNAITGKLDIQNNELNVALTINGTSSLMLQYIFNCDMNALGVLNNGMITDQRMSECMELLSQMFTEELKPQIGENVKVNLSIAVDQEAQKKQQVCFGMLFDEIGTMAAVAVHEEEMDDNARAAAVKRTQQKLVNFEADKLKKFLAGDEQEKGLIHYLREYEKLYFAKAYNNTCYGLGPNTQNISQLLENCWQSRNWGICRNVVAQRQARYMVEREQENYQDLLACMYLVEEIIDREMAIRQA